MMVCEKESIGRRTHDVVVDHPDPSWLQHPPHHVLVRVDGHRFVVNAPSDCRDIVDILWVVEII